MIKNIDTTFNKGHLDNWLDQMAQNPRLWPEATEEKVKSVVKEIQELKKSKHKVAGTSAGLAAVGSILGIAPFGGAIGAPFAFSANYYGTAKGVEIGFKYAKESDLKQDLFHDTGHFYLSLAIRLLDRFLKARQVQYADKIEASEKVNGLLDEEKRARLIEKSKKISSLAERVLNILEEVENNAADLLIAKPTQEKPKKRFFAKRVDPKKEAKKAEHLARVQSSIRSITSPLREVCMEIQSEKKVVFSDPILRNEKETMKLRLKRRLEKRAYHAKIADLTSRLEKLERGK